MLVIVRYISTYLKAVANIALFLVASLSHLAYAAPGRLDTTFGFDNNGTVSYLIGENVTGGGAPFNLHVLSDNKILVAFNDADLSNPSSTNTRRFMRLESDGSIDASYANLGILSYSTGHPIRGFSGSVNIQTTFVTSDEGVLSIDRDLNSQFIVLSKFTPDGLLDTAYGDNGRVVTTIKSYIDASLQTDGKLVIAYSGVSLRRYNTDGSIDTSFADGGKLTYIPTGVGSEIPTALTTLADGKILVSSTDTVTYGGYNTLLRINPHGSIDDTFVLNNKPIFPQIPLVRSMIQQPDGKIIFIGFDNITTSIIVTRLNSDGSTDNLFGNAGVVTIDNNTFSNPYTSPLELTVMPDGKYIISSSDAPDCMVTRLRPNGVIDTAFGDSGFFLEAYEAGASYNLAIPPCGEDQAVAKQVDGKLLLVTYGGSNFSLSPSDVRLYRLQGDNLDVTPDVVAFTSSNNVQTNILQVSNTITISGIDPTVSVPVHVANGTYSVNDGSFTSNYGWVTDGDQLKVQHTSSQQAGTTTETT
ncbi:MAG: hypothetical protein OEY89_18005, partial [Gammaproteobacteria bacterium]|nr:hypothetical protein [Gammaproteobacteria bacterium]